MFSLAPFLFRDVVDPAPRYDNSRYEDLLSELCGGNPYRDLYSSPHSHSHFILRPRRQTSVGSGQQSDSRSDSNQFKVMLNVKHFRPDEIDVKTVDNFVVVHGKHEEHADEHGFVTREFTRRYQLPEDVVPEKVTSSLSKDGVLTIQAPKKMIEPPKNERVVPITIQQPAAVEEAQKIAEQQQQQQQQQMQTQEASEDTK